MYSNVISFIEDRKEELIELACMLVQKPTPNPPGDGQLDFAFLVYDWLRNNGIKASLIATDDDNTSAPAILASVGAGNPKLCLQGHYDTIPPSTKWHRSPYCPVKEGDLLYGLGMTDMKGALACMMMAVNAINRCSGLVRGELHLLFTPDEEYPSGPGIRYLIEKKIVPPGVYIVGEPSSVDEIHIGMKEAIFGDIVFQGISAHGSTPGRGVNAFQTFMEFQRYMEIALKPYLNISYQEHSINPPNYANSTIMLGGIIKNTNGARSVVPDYFSSSFDIRVIPGSHAPPILNAIKASFKEFLEINPGIQGDIKVSSTMPSYLIPEDQTFIKDLKAIVETISERKCQLTVSAGGMETSLLMAEGIIAPAFGPGRWENAHAPDEYVKVSELVKAAKIYAAIALKSLNGKI